MSEKRQRGFWIIAALLFACARLDAHPVAQGSLSIQIFPNKIVVRGRVSMEEVFVQNALSADAKDSSSRGQYRVAMASAAANHTSTITTIGRRSSADAIGTGRIVGGGRSSIRPV